MAIMKDTLCSGLAISKQDLISSFGGTDCGLCLQISAGQKLTGRTCATALSACERQGMIWVYLNPGAAPSQDSIPGECLHPRAAAVLPAEENKRTESSLL